MEDTPAAHAAAPSGAAFLTYASEDFGGRSGVDCEKIEVKWGNKMMTAILPTSCKARLSAVICLGIGAASAFAQGVPGAGAARSGSSTSNRASTNEATSSQQYTAPDQTASVELPAGWRVTKSGHGLIDAAGPNGETVDLGRVIVARDAAFQPGNRGGGGADINLPYQATLDQKFTMIVQSSAAVAHRAAPQVSIISTTPIEMPAEFGQCARILGGITGQSGPEKFEVAFCSMPLDAGGLYKNIFKLATVPARLGAQERATLEAVMRSFTIPQDLVGQLFEPASTQPEGTGGDAAQGTSAQGNGAQANGATTNASRANAVPGTASRTAQQMTGAQKIAEANAINASTIAGVRSSNRNAECFDLVVLRETPKSQLPRKCGGYARN